MIELFTQEDFNNAKCKDLLPLLCDNCGNNYWRTKHRIKTIYSDSSHNTGKYCSKKCKRTGKNVICLQCNRIFYKTLAMIKRSPNHFCSRSCAATYNNAHKTTGTRRSKLEKWLEEQLTNFYPGLEILYNSKKAINSELDIYIPSLKLAFELNGIFHYEPIYGQNKLDQIQNNDNRKFQACLENNISLCIIDSSDLKYFKPKSAQKYLDIIINIINKY